MTAIENYIDFLKFSLKKLKKFYKIRKKQYRHFVCSMKFFGIGSIFGVVLDELTLKLAYLCDFNGVKKSFFYFAKFFLNNFEFVA